MNAGRFQGDTWAVSRRVPPFEYEGLTRDLNIEKADLNRSKVASTYGSARLDYEYVDGTMSTAEAGITQVENEVLVTGIGRVQVPKAIKPWGRVSYNSNHWYVQLWGAGRNSLRPQVSLALDLPLEEQSFIGQADVQYRFSGLDENLSVILGAAHRYQSVDTKGTLTLMAHHDNLSGLYAQIEYKILDELKSIIAGRWDRSTLHESQFSPKIALVWSPVPGHSFRATFNKAFQAPNYAELFLHVVPPKDPSQFVQLAFFGNEHLSVEKITGYELGYKGVFGDVLFLSVDGYYNQLRDFITDLTPNVNLQYGGSETLPGENFERTIFSYGNAGKVNEAGFEVSMNYYLTNALQFNANYSFFTFEVTEEHTEHDLLPNAPGYKINGGVSYGVDDWQIGLSVKYVPTFDWKAGVYRTDPVTGRGRVVAYTLLNVNASYKFTPHLELGLNVTNLLDRQHYEILGGSLIGRRALASLTAFF
jgi:iron complex outermembrane receptor protein